MSTYLVKLSLSSSVERVVNNGFMVVGTDPICGFLILMILLLDFSSGKNNSFKLCPNVLGSSGGIGKILLFISFIES